MRRPSLLLCAAALLVSALAACGNRAPTPIAATPAGGAPPARAGDQGKEPATSEPDGTPPNLPPEPRNGPGLVICDPVSRDAGPAALELATGCSRWLQFWVSGQPEFGKSPLYSVVGEHAVELERKDLRLERTGAQALAQSLGATHAVVGEVAGDASGLRVTYDLLDLAARKSVGAATLAASPREVVAQLPKVARQLCERLGAREPRWLAAPRETVADLQLLGRLPRSPDERVNGRDEIRLSEGISRSDLLALAYMIFQANKDYPEAIESAFKQLSPRARDNPVMLADLGRQTSNAGWKAVSVPVGKLRALRSTHPRHFLYNAALAYALRGSDFEAAMTASERAVECAPRNPKAWMLLKGTISDEHNRVRQGRYAQDLNEKELAQDAEFSAASLKILEQVVRMAPRSTARLDLSLSAAFAGDRALAEAAFWESHALRPHSMAVHHWGLQMYHAKWYDEPANAAKVAKSAVAASKVPDNGWSAEDRIEVAARAYLVGFRREAYQIVAPGYERDQMEKWLKKSQEYQVRRRPVP